jgi:hypothetical protein
MPPLRVEELHAAASRRRTSCRRYGFEELADEEEMADEK